MTDVLLVGLGSVGKRHLAAATQLGYTVVGVDPKPSLYLGEELKGIELHSELKSLRGRHFGYCVIANWGPDHVTTLIEAHEMGLSSKFVIEKPLCGSFKDLRQLQNLVSTGLVEFVLSFPRRYVDFNQHLEEATDGSPTSISVWGGAQCISTYGSHWLDVAIGLFGLPNSVIANLNSQPINPRSAGLDFFEGIASYQFSGGKKLDISFDNKSWVSSTSRFLFRNGFLEIKDGRDFYIEKVEDDLIQGTPVTRTKSPSNAQKLESNFSWDEAFVAMHQRVSENVVTEDEMEHDLKVAAWLLMAFESSSEAGLMSERDLNRAIAMSESAWNIS